MDNKKELSNKRRTHSESPPAKRFKTEEPLEHREHIISVLSCILEQLIKTCRDDGTYVSVFHSQSAPSISICDYLARISQYSECSDATLILAVYHIATILRIRPGFCLSSFNVHRLLLASTMCASKFHDDSYYSNAFFAKIGGVSGREMNRLEIEFLDLITFELFVPAQQFEQFFAEISSPALHARCDCVVHQQQQQLLQQAAANAAADSVPMMADSPMPSPLDFIHSHQSHPGCDPTDARSQALAIGLSPSPALSEISAISEDSSLQSPASQSDSEAEEEEDVRMFRDEFCDGVSHYSSTASSSSFAHAVPDVGTLVVI